MNLNDVVRGQLEAVYRPGMTVEDLGVAAGCRRFAAHLFLGEQLFLEAVVELHEQGLSYREIARELGVNHSMVHRALKRVGQAGGSPPTDEAPQPADEAVPEAQATGANG
jgi:hypothetical protein